jgi:hypothetical protein
MSVSTLASFEYLERLPGTTFRRLYQQPSTSLAIFRRMLPHLGMKLLVIRRGMLTINSEDICYGFAVYDEAFSTYRSRPVGPSR